MSLPRFTAAALAASIPAHAWAQEREPVDSAAVQGGVLASSLLDEQLTGTGGASLGEVVNLYIGEDAKIASVLVDGDRHVLVPFEALNIGEAGVSVDASDLSGFEPYATAALEQDGRTYRASDLIDDRALLQGETGIGVVTDLVFTSGGTLLATLIDTDEEAFGEGGVRAFPFYGYESNEFDPLYSSYHLPYSLDEARNMPSIEIAG